jgi:ketosteroid isomerase-like protein
MKKFIAICWVFALLGGLLFGSGRGESEATVLEELLALDTAALDPWYGESDPTIYAQHFADKATYFDPWSGGKLEDSAIKEYIMTFTGQIPNCNYEILYPRVDLYGETAVFTFNVAATIKADNTLVNWNATHIFTRTKDGWEKVHATWSFTEPGS